MPTKQDLATSLGILCEISDKRPVLLYGRSPKNKQRLLVSFKSLVRVSMTEHNSVSRLVYDISNTSKIWCPLMNLIWFQKSCKSFRNNRTKRSSHWEFLCRGWANKWIEIKHFELKQLFLWIYFLPLNHSPPSSRLSFRFIFRFLFILHWKTAGY